MGLWAKDSCKQSWTHSLHRTSVGLMGCNDTAIKQPLVNFRLLQWCSWGLFLGCGTTSLDKWYLTSCASVVVSLSGVKMPTVFWIILTLIDETTGTHQPVTQSHIPEEQRPQTAIYMLF